MNPRARGCHCPTIPQAKRKATKKTTTARSMRWPRNSRASAGMRTSRSGNRLKLVFATSIGVEAESQRPGADEGHEITLPLPGGGFAQGRDQFIVGLRPRRRAGAIFDGTRDEDHGIAGDRELALAALAPQLKHGLAVVADFHVRQPFRSGLTRHV